MNKTISRVTISIAEYLGLIAGLCLAIVCTIPITLAIMVHEVVRSGRKGRKGRDDNENI